MFCLQLLFNLGALTHAAAQIIQLGPADRTVADNLDGIDRGGMNREDLLHADAVGDAADGDGFLNAAVFLCDNGALTFTWTRTVSPICTLGVSLPSASLFSSLMRSMDFPPVMIGVLARIFRAAFHVRQRTALCSLNRIPHSSTDCKDFLRNFQ